ncbi:hypothetical protein [Melittangium boletus]|uniref:Uncharacterized protein n=1 Tax=Melittangium boletus DSM 14713 TaxID=1294270 RepID=A0A250IHR2_9BACT|nr:hypothetical protein [Melittangium boletus]ATB30701.1 hypothetical protein MEBOL_004162 [Melittangium boletus DSM 14713]
MASSQSKTLLGTVMVLLGLLAWGAAPWGVTSGLLLTLGYALGWVSRSRSPAKTAPALMPLDMSQLTTEQLFQELERQNRASLQR